MNYNWKAAVRNAERHRSASSGTLSGFRRIKFYSSQGKVYYKQVTGNVKEVGSLTDIGPRTIHFAGVNGATFTELNSHDHAIIRALTQAIINGDIKITGSYTCANKLGQAPSPDAGELVAESPVPICVNDDDDFSATVGKVRVTRGSATWYIWKAHLSYQAGDRELDPGRVYMMGGDESIRVPQEESDVIGGDTRTRAYHYSGKSNLLTEGKVPRLFLILTTVGSSRLMGVASQNVVDHLVAGGSKTKDVYLRELDSPNDATNCLQVIRPGWTINERSHTKLTFKHKNLNINLYLSGSSVQVENIRAVVLNTVPLPEMSWGYHCEALMQMYRIKKTFPNNDLSEYAALFGTDVRSFLDYYTRAPARAPGGQSLCYIDNEGGRRLRVASARYIARSGWCCCPARGGFRVVSKDR